MKPHKIHYFTEYSSDEKQNRSIFKLTEHIELVPSEHSFWEVDTHINCAWK